VKKYILLFSLVSFVAVIYLSYPFGSEEGYVSIKENKFHLNGKMFYPIAINYITSTQVDKNNLWISPYWGYTPDSKPPCTTKDSSLLQLKADMELIKEMGFNTVRIVGAGEESINEKTGALSVYAKMGNKKDTSISLSSDESYEKYLNALDVLFDAANHAGLKVIFLIKLAPGLEATENHLRRVVARFKDDTCIMAYDFFNEPLYFDLLERNKMDVFPIVRRWSKIIKLYAPHQLSTIGLSSIREIFEWDPNMLHVDFISFHPYEVEPEQVRNELYWYGHYLKKPWIIGETGIPADNDSISYEDQKKWAHKTLKQAYDCGASGYSWWQYKDVEWHQYHANYLGVVTRKGETKSAKTNMIVQGTPKPVAKEFKLFDPNGKKDSCLCLSNYYNYSQHKSFRIIGYLKDMNNIPIQGGIFLAWNQSWSHSYHTIIKEDGSFELLSDFPFYHWIASATLYSMTRGEILPETAKKYNDSIPTINIGTLKLEKLAIED